MTTLYLDTEFNGHGGNLISIALVSAEGEEFYKVLPINFDLDPWVAENVIPKIDKLAESPLAIQRELFAFLRKFETLTIVADWYADFVHLFRFFEGPDFQSSLDMSVTAVLKSGPSDIRPDVPHNALSDARALRDYWEKRHSASVVKE